MTELPSQRTRRQELERIERLGISPLPSPFTTRVVGVSFTAGYPSNLHRLGRLLEIGAVEGVPAIIIRNPANEHDANACEVHIPSLGDQGMIGHLPAAMAARLAPELDAGGTWQAYVVDILVHPDHDDRPGITIHLQRIEEEEHG